MEFRERINSSVRVLWALAAWVVLMSQYVMHGWWQTAQRESFYDLLVIASIAVQLHAQRPYEPARVLLGRFLA